MKRCLSWKPVDDLRILSDFVPIGSIDRVDELEQPLGALVAPTFDLEDGTPGSDAE